MRNRKTHLAAILEVVSEILIGNNVLRLGVSGNSMLPFIRDGDVVLVEPVETGSIGQGDVILYRNDSEGLLVHRVVRVGREGDRLSLAIGGDALAELDGIFPGERVLGRVRMVERGGRQIQLDTGVWGVIGSLWLHFPRLCRIIYLGPTRIRRRIRTLLPGGRFRQSP